MMNLLSTYLIPKTACPGWLRLSEYISCQARYPIVTARFDREGEIWLPTPAPRICFQKQPKAEKIIDERLERTVEKNVLDIDLLEVVGWLSVRSRKSWLNRISLSTDVYHYGGRVRIEKWMLFLEGQSWKSHKVIIHKHQICFSGNGIKRSMKASPISWGVQLAHDLWPHLL